MKLNECSLKAQRNQIFPQAKLSQKTSIISKKNPQNLLPHKIAAKFNKRKERKTTNDIKKNV